MSDTPVILPDDTAALKAMIAHLQAENARMDADITKISATLRAHEALVQALQIQIARLKKQKFGASSERIEREIEQLEFALEHLEIAGAAAISAIAPDDDAELSADEQAAMASTPRRRKPLVAEGTPRERIVLDPGDDCPHCGGTLRLIGEDVSEILELISARLKLIETARLKKSCRRCEKITQLPAPSRPIPRSMVGPGLLAHVLVSKFDDHLPLYRQNEIFARMGASIPASTLVDWCGQGVRVLEPLVERIRANILASDRLHADDTPVRVLDPSKRIDGIGKGVKEGRIWTYVRDDRPWGSSAPPGAAYFFSVDRKGEHPPATADRNARRALFEAWIGRETATFALPPSRLALDPTDVVSIENDGRSLDFALTQIADGEARRVESSRRDQTVYGLPEGPSRGVSTAVPVVYGPPDAEILDLPQLSEDVAAYRPLAAVAASPWYGQAAIWRSASLDGFSLFSTASVPAQFGTLAATLAAGPSWRFDLANALLVDISSGSLQSVTDEQLFAGSNALALETAPGTWEVLQFGLATIVTTGRWKLTRLLRGHPTPIHGGYIQLIQR